MSAAISELTTDTRGAGGVDESSGGRASGSSSARRAVKDCIGQVVTGA